MTHPISLRNVYLFSHLSDERLAEIEAALESRDLKAGEELFNMGDSGDELFVVADGDFHVADLAAFRHAGEELDGHLRQQRAGEDLVNVSGTGVDLGAAAGNAVDHLGREAERRPVVVVDSAGDVQSAPALEDGDLTELDPAAVNQVNAVGRAADTNITGCSPDEVVCDMKVEITWADITEDFSLPRFRPAL